MQTINIHEAKTHLSRLFEEVAQGKSFIIVKAGKPMVKVLPLSAEEGKAAEKFGFMKGEISTPDDFDSLGATEIKGFLQFIRYPNLHKDPFDRLLLTQARSEGMLLLTGDRRPLRFPISRIRVGGVIFIRITDRQESRPDLLLKGFQNKTNKKSLDSGLSPGMTKLSEIY